jgi:hypothetical protein
MRRYSQVQFFLIVFVFLFACDSASQKSNADSSTVKKTSSSPDADTSDSYVNISGDSVNYYHWAAEDEIIGLKNKAFR